VYTYILWPWRCRFTEFKVADVEHPESIAPLQTFAVNKKVMFVDDSTFPDKALLTRLTPPSPYDVPAGEVKDNDKDTDGKKGSKV
jgi:hypothetical protein